MRTFWLLLLPVLVILCGCTDVARQLQIHTADAVAEGANAALPMLVAEYKQEGVEVIRKAETRDEAETGLARIERSWATVWDAWEMLRAAQDAWATALEKGAALESVFHGLKTAYCALKRVWPQAIPAVPLVPVTCGEGP